MASDQHDHGNDHGQDLSRTGPQLRLADLAQRRDHRFLRQPDTPSLAALARELDLLDLRKVRFDGTLKPVGREDWDLTGHLGATVVQPCVATLAPVTTRIEEKVIRRFRADLPEYDDATEIEMPEDDTLDPLPDTIDLDAILTEALSLALPPYPRADDVGPVQALFAEPGQQPLDDDAVKPFAGLAALRTRLDDDAPPQGTPARDGAERSENDPDDTA